MPGSQSTEWLLVPEVMRMLRQTRHRVMDWAMVGELEARKFGDRTLISRASVLRVLRERENAESGAASRESTDTPQPAA